MAGRVFPAAWQGYRRRNRVAVLALVGGLPLAFAAAIAVKLVFGGGGEALLVSAVLLWCALWGWAAIRVARWPCPRCGAPWLSNQEARIGAPRACAKCGLGLYAEP